MGSLQLELTKLYLVGWTVWNPWPPNPHRCPLSWGTGTNGRRLHIINGQVFVATQHTHTHVIIWPSSLFVWLLQTAQVVGPRMWSVILLLPFIQELLAGHSTRPTTRGVQFCFVTVWQTFRIGNLADDGWLYSNGKPKLCNFAHLVAPIL